MIFWIMVWESFIYNDHKEGEGDQSRWYFSDSLLSTAIPIYTNVSQLINSLIKNVLFLVPTDKVLELGFPKWIKAWLSVKILSNAMLEKLFVGNNQDTTHPAWLLNPTISKFCHPSYIVITPHNFEILLSLLRLSHFKNFKNLIALQMEFVWIGNPT